MKTLTLEEVVRAVQGKLLVPMGTVRVSGVSTDTRSVRPGDLFVALKGPRFDGHDFVHAALEQGASAAVVAHACARGKYSPDRAGLIWVHDTLEALGRLGTYHRRLLAAQVIGVTGSNGKTTVKMMIDQVLSGTRRGRASPRSFNNQVGVPLTLLSAESNDEYLVVEIGTNAPGEIAALGRLAEPNVAVITNVAEAHLEGLGSIQGVAAEKVSLLPCLRTRGHAVLNADCPALMEAVPDALPVTRTTFGIGPRCDLRATRVATDGDTTRFQVNGRFEYRLTAPGRHNVHNALAAIAVARRMGLEHERIAERLETFALPGMRLEWHRLGDVEVIFDAYNANPASMTAALEVLADRRCRGRKVAVLGDMNELGESAERLHRELGGRLSECGATLLVAIGRWAKVLASAAPKSLERHVYGTPEAATDELASLLRPGDLVLIKGSRALRLERLLENLAAGRTIEAPRGPGSPNAKHRVWGSLESAVRRGGSRCSTTS